jgi:hypothetical protein
VAGVANTRIIKAGADQVNGFADRNFLLITLIAKTRFDLG